MNKNNYIVEAINILEEWGMMKIFEPYNTEGLDLLKNEYEEILKQGIAQEEILEAIEKDAGDIISSSKKSFSDIDIIINEPGAESWIAAEESMKALDRIVFLSEAIRPFSPNEQSSGNKVLSKLEQLLEEMQEFILDSGWSPLRLTVMNEFRRAFLEKIPDDKRDMFPWYSCFSDCASNTIQILIDNYNSIIYNFEIPALPENITGNNPEILYELYKDDGLLAVVEDEYHLRQKTKEALSARSALRLWWLSDEYGYEYLIDDKVSKKGLVRISSKLIGSATESMRNEAERIFWLFMSAFCGPNLSNEQRLNVLKTVEEKMWEMDRKDISVSTEKQAMLTTLFDWFYNKKIDEKEFVKAAFSVWNYFLVETEKSTAEAGVYDEDVSIFSNAIDKLAAHPIEDSGINELIRKLLGGTAIAVTYMKLMQFLVLQNIRLHADRIPYNAADAEESEQISSPIIDSPISIKCRKNDEGIYKILPPITLADGEDINKYKNLINKFISKIESLNYGVCFVEKDGKLSECTVYKNSSKYAFLQLQAIEVKDPLALIAFSDKEEEINNFKHHIEDIQKLVDSKSSDSLLDMITKVQKLNIGIIICEFVLDL